jgi:hypothetical protein
MDMSQIQTLFEQLAGQKAPFTLDGGSCAHRLLDGEGMGWSQFNEVMLLLGFDRVSHPFFQYLVDRTAAYQLGAAIMTAEQLRVAVSDFRVMAMLRFGNIKHAFKEFSVIDEQELEAQLAMLAPIPDSVFAQRHAPARPLELIDGRETYYLGYIVASEIERRLRTNPDDPSAKADDEKRRSLIARANRNHEAYLASDHMDVYVATSMREKHEYFFVHAFTQKIFADPRLERLKLRWFDPTQAYCHDRIDKGLSEALMLKRAQCTLYFAQETDTLGKDSELASTLAQGKPVIAFVPRIDAPKEGNARRSKHLQWMLEEVVKLNPDKPREVLLREQFQLFAPKLAWEDVWTREWVADPKSKPVEEVETRLLEIVRNHYDRRATMLKDTHPLGVQVNLATGVANGVLVARTTAECAELIYRVVTKRLKFKITPRVIGDKEYLLLVEEVTGSVFRVVSGDALLTHAFWNFYLEGV